MDDLKRAENTVVTWEDPARQTDRRVNDDEAPQYIERLDGAYFSLGIGRWSAKAPEAEVRRCLRLAGEYAVLCFEQRREPGVQTSRNFYELVQRVLGPVACFCDPSWRQRLRAVPQWRYDWDSGADYLFIPGKQETPRGKAYKYLRAYSQCALDLLATGTFSQADAAPFRTVLEAGKGPKKDNEGEESLHAFRALQAIVDGDQATLQNSIEGLLALHKRSATRGAYRTMDEGRIAMHAMFLAQMAKERGITIATLSEYLPLHLLAAPG